MGGHHALFLQFEFPRFLCEGAGGTAPTAAEIAASSAFDTITVADTLAAGHLDEAAQPTADGESAVREAVSTTGLAAFGVRIALTFEMLETGFVLSIDDAGQPPSHKA